jgi:hypothetical protein
MPTIVSKTQYADDVLRRKLDPRARQLIEDVRDDWRASPETLRRSERDEALGVGPTRGRELEDEIPAYLEGRSRVTPARSVYIYKINKILASFPLNEPPQKERGGTRLLPHTVAARTKAPSAKPVHVLERTATPSPAGEAKRGRGRPRNKQPELTATPAE